MSSNFDTYAGFRTAVYTWLDATTGDLSADLVDDMARIAQRHIENGCTVMMGGRSIFIPPLMCRDNEKAFGVAGAGIAITNGVAAVPSDYLRTKNAYLTSGGVKYPIERKEVDAVYKLFGDRSFTSMPIIYAREIDSFIFGPVPNTSLMYGTYYRSFSDFTGTTLSLTDSGSTDYNKLYANNWNAYLFATLKECEPLLFREARAQMWAEKYYSVVMAKDENDELERFSGSSLSVSSNYIPP